MHYGNMSQILTSLNVPSSTRGIPRWTRQADPTRGWTLSMMCCSNGNSLDYVIKLWTHYGIIYDIRLQVVRTIKSSIKTLI